MKEGGPFGPPFLNPQQMIENQTSPAIMIVTHIETIKALRKYWVLCHN